MAAPKSGPNLTPSPFRPERPPRARILSPRQVAECLQVSKREVLRWLRGGDLRGLRIDNEWHVSERQLDAFLEERANIPANTGVFNVPVQATHIKRGRQTGEHPTIPSRHGGMKMLRCLLPLILVALIGSLFSHGSRADTNAEKMAKMLGSVIGMADACGYAVSEDWLAASTKTIKDNSIGSDDLRSAQKFRDEYSRVTLAQQKAQPQMNCADVLRSLGDFEHKLVE